MLRKSATQHHYGPQAGGGESPQEGISAHNFTPNDPDYTITVFPVFLSSPSPGTLGGAMTENEICKALASSGIEIRLRYDYVPSSDDDTAAYQALDFHDRTWRNLILTATGRRKMSKQLNETQTCLVVLGSGRLVGGLRVRVLTLEAALNLQNAGYKLESNRAGSIEKTAVPVGHL